MLCASELMILFSTYHVTNHLTCHKTKQVETDYKLKVDQKSKFLENISIFHKLRFHIEVLRFGT